MIEPYLSPFATRVARKAPTARAAARAGASAALFASLAMAAFAGSAHAQGRGGSAVTSTEHRGPLDLPVADPAKVVATEQAFARAAQEKGQWAAFAEYAADDAIMFVPQPVNAQTWLRDRPSPPQSVRWQPHEVWTSCDGSLAVSRGAWQRPDGTVGYFTTVWAQQERQEDGYRWILDQGDALEEPLDAPASVETVVADCPFTGSTGMSESDLAALDAEALSGGASTAGSGWSADSTLAYRYAVQPSGAREFVVLMVKDGRVQEIIHSEVAAP